MPKNIVICLDGTGNQIEKNLSNVLKLYRTLEKKEEKGQVVFYDQGVGTLGQKYAWGRVLQWVQKSLGSAFGFGLDKNVLQAYRFIVQHYQETKPKTKGSKLVRDKIYIFGYSRGAHTARVLAGLIYQMGLLHPEQIHLAGAALTAYKRADSEEGIEEADHFRRISVGREVAIEFLGVWDTVSSVIVPKFEKFWPLSLEKLPHTRCNPAVKTFRQAMSIDEKRRMFRLDPWHEPQEFLPNKHAEKPGVQDVQQVWFAGSHGDVGGGYNRLDSAISQFPLIWMINEVKKSKIKIYKRMADHVTGIKPYSVKTQHVYPKPDYKANIHPSIKGFWFAMEIIPKLERFREWKKRFSILWLYIPWAEPRVIKEGSNIHQSAIDRFNDNDLKYKPQNFPKKYKPIK